MHCSVCEAYFELKMLLLSLVWLLEMLKERYL